MNLRISNESSSMQISTEESLESYGDSNTRENNDSVAYAFTEVATLNGKGDDYLFQQQEQVLNLNFCLDITLSLIIFSLVVSTMLVTYFFFTLRSASQKILRI